MNNKICDKLIALGAETAFMDSNISSDLRYRPQFIYNNAKDGKKVLSTIENELSLCDEFIICVAFVTMGGVTPLLQTLKEFSDAGKKGKFLTTDYLMFSDPKALEKLNQIKNIEVRMFCTEKAKAGFHTKGYIFKHNELYTIITGSSNLTNGALTKNKEWNTKIVATNKGEFSREVINEFNVFWNSQYTKTYDEFIEHYKTKYSLIKEQRKVATDNTPVSLSQYNLKPNDMQVEFVQNLKDMIDNGESRALLISATGTGKTYASAFAIRDLCPKRMLFIVHRELIAKQALNSFKNVIGNNKSFGLLSGSSKDTECDCLFSTMQTISKEDVYIKFSPDYFDTIIIDEVHRAGANSYKKIMDYFNPKFWLGMTASPDRTDGFDIYKLFNNNIAYEIRLQQALEENYLCPFHYFGISELEVDGKVFDDATSTENFRYLVSEERINHIIEQIKYYGYSGDRPKGLIFCNLIKEAEELSKLFNERGYKTLCLSGSNSPKEREEAIERLSSDKRDDYLEYILTVDIFNEGVDIPEINQVIMLRPTQSPIVFIQQLGRGLRKSSNKEYVVILDFIGNYNNNFMIPMALSGDRSYNKDTIRRYVREGNRVIPGDSTIHFDEISRKRIYSSIDTVSTKKALLLEKYLVLKNKLGRIPTICDFYNYGEIDPLLFIDYSANYHSFLCGISNKEREYDGKLNNIENNILDFISVWLANGKRPHELVMLKLLIDNGCFNCDTFKNNLKDYSIEYNRDTEISAFKFLHGEFVNTASEKKKYTSIGIIDYNNDTYKIGEKFKKALSNSCFKSHVLDVISFGLKRYSDIYMNIVDDLGLGLYQKYSRKDVCRILNWEHDDSSTMYGYRIKYNTCPIFVTYEKKDNISDSTKYEDKFINNGQFSWMTRNRVSLDHDEAQSIINSQKDGLKILLFIKKSDGEGSDFYYMGQVSPKGWKETTITDKNGKELPIVNFQFEMNEYVRDDIYDYITA